MKSLFVRIGLGALATASVWLFAQGCVGDEPSTNAGADAGDEAEASPSSGDDGAPPDAGLANGAACTTPAACSSGFCVDGVCCESACDGQCQACDVTPGFCTQVPSGQPHGTRPHCAGEGTACGGACNNTPTACTYPGTTVHCRDQSCTGSTRTEAASCDGKGACPQTTTTCGAFLCNGTDCRTTCADNTQCVSPAVCQCPPSGPCTNKVCAGTKTNGTACSGNGECASGFCVDGVCCNAACSGQCQACDVTPGTCTTVTTGQPHGTRTACTNAGNTCGGVCDGASPTACTYKSASTKCNSSCKSSSTETDFFCDGAGACSTSGVDATCAGGFACSGSACLKSCTGPSDCQANFSCSGNQCQCGALSQACCGGSVCSAGSCSAGTCQNCGALGQACCQAPSASCANVNTLLCSGSQCVACGYAGEPCCSNYPRCGNGGPTVGCGSSNICAGNCGHLGTVCCEQGSPCTDTNSVCNASSKICAPCGTPGNLCCFPNSCNTGSCQASGYCG